MASLAEAKEHKDFEMTDRVCPLCKGFMAQIFGHSIGKLHAICIPCKFCEDCDDGAV